MPVRVGGDTAHVDLGVSGLERSQAWDEPIARRGCGNRDCNDFSGVVVEVLNIPDCLVDSRKSGTNSIGQNPALGGEAYPPMVPFEEGAAEPSLQLSDGVADRRLPDLQLVGCAGKTVMSCHDGERVETLDRGQLTSISPDLGSNLIHDTMRLLFLYR